MDPYVPYVLHVPPNLDFMKKAYLVDIQPIDKLL